MVRRGEQPGRRIRERAHEDAEQSRGWWQGPAYDAFSGYLTGDNGPVQASNSNAGHMVAVCKQLLQAYGEIIDVYNQSVQKMADVAVTMSKYAPWKIQNMLRTTEAASNLLSDFASTIAKWEIDHRNALRAYITNSKQTMTEIQAIIEPNDFPSSALIAKKWHYRKDQRSCAVANDDGRAGRPRGGVCCPVRCRLFGGEASSGLFGCRPVHRNARLLCADAAVAGQAALRRWRASASMTKRSRRSRSARG
ncbi:hypothetical protein [Actinoallomurus iriomotensis]|uniref:Uncharacterized protein n=1 Tax=Actinoallomurus iriomotensis TaxID=478107 RepID=A0A9W6S3Y8_9ACTN|nr:hypothetical protein [Actinoallomurus iriomotensis]GLY84955.1 hypothetical protein Airi02_028840 [Actinoallomurus iriomotensis]